MSYTTSWAPDAMEVIEQIWLVTNDRDAVLRAMWDIEAALRDDPHDVGESRPDE